jgi:hypothetical protein
MGPKLSFSRLYDTPPPGERAVTPLVQRPTEVVDIHNEREAEARERKLDNACDRNFGVAIPTKVRERWVSEAVARPDACAAIVAARMGQMTQSKRTRELAPPIDLSVKRIEPVSIRDVEKFKQGRR